MMKQGVCSLRSESDSRWNAQAEGMVGMFMGVEQSPLRETFEALKKALGEPPADLKFSYHKF